MVLELILKTVSTVVAVDGRRLGPPIDAGPRRDTSTKPLQVCVEGIPPMRMAAKVRLGRVEREGIEEADRGQNPSREAPEGSTSGRSMLHS